MNLVTYDPKTPEGLLALDELALFKAERGELGATLRFWTSNEYFVALGRASRANDECFGDRCASDGVKIIRRVSGGGTVLQGPGCLNYSLVLSYGHDERCRNINNSYSFILGGISGFLNTEGYPAEFLPVSDIAYRGMKISGNAQARKRSFFLHHGTFLLGFDIGKMSDYLKHPLGETEYRAGRAHTDFCRNIGIGRDTLVSAIKGMFPQGEEEWNPGEDDIAQLESLVSEKYANPAWNLAF